ncbi:NAD(P)-binding protein [Neurospora tetrasperma FGSC 2509]|nr:NAD(P)-binding protein [Neurospora tetrasperma FGSC 2509]
MSLKPEDASPANVPLPTTITTTMSARKSILITGAGGLVGPLLATRLLCDSNYSQHTIYLTDLAPPIVPSASSSIPADRLKDVIPIQGDITSPSFVSSLISATLQDGANLSAVFIFHGIMSAGSEANFELSLKVNVDSVRLLLDEIRTQAPGTRVIYSSSQAIYGQPLPAVVTDDVTPTPQSTYGAHKLMMETYINDLHRKGYIEGFVVRFPTISVRPGKPTAAASSFLSGIIREPLAGKECVVPIEDRGFRSYLSSPSTIAENLVRVLEMDSDKLPEHRRSVNFPGISVSVQELLDALEKFGGKEKLGLVKEKRDKGLEKVLRSWPTDFDTSRAVGELGLVVDEGVDGLVGEYVESLKRKE